MGAELSKCDLNRIKIGTTQLYTHKIVYTSWTVLEPIFVYWKHKNLTSLDIVLANILPVLLKDYFGHLDH